MHVACIHAAAAAATCKHAASTTLAATHATAHANGLWALALPPVQHSNFRKVSPNGNAATGSGKRHELLLHMRAGACGKMWKCPDARRNGNGPIQRMKLAVTRPEVERRLIQEGL
eukprot:356919-Chlamydomonas_euryale.AAC.1